MRVLGPRLVGYLLFLDAAIVLCCLEMSVPLVGSPVVRRASARHLLPVVSFSPSGAAQKGRKWNLGNQAMQTAIRPFEMARFLGWKSSKVVSAYPLREDSTLSVALLPRLRGAVYLMLDDVGTAARYRMLKRAGVRRKDRCDLLLEDEILEEDGRPGHINVCAQVTGNCQTKEKPCIWHPCFSSLVPFCKKKEHSMHSTKAHAESLCQKSDFLLAP